MENYSPRAVVVLAPPRLVVDTNHRGRGRCGSLPADDTEQGVVSNGGISRWANRAAGVLQAPTGERHARGARLS